LIPATVVTVSIEVLGKATRAWLLGGQTSKSTLLPPVLHETNALFELYPFKAYQVLVLQLMTLTDLEALSWVCYRTVGFDLQAALIRRWTRGSS